MIKRICLILVCTVFFTNLEAQEYSPKYEFRGVWIATVSNIDWPSEPGLKPKEQRKEFIDLLDFHQALGLNAVIVQVRAASDAFYESDIEPWSYWLTGKQGKPPRPFYDPLEFMIQECHKRKMEFHAWINPFRATTSVNMKTHRKHITNMHPEWIIDYAGQKVIDPGIPEARKYISNVIEEIVRKYDIDAIHFDDYFYPYPENGNTFPDEKTFKKNKKGIKDIHDWRRNNIDKLIQSTHKIIEKHNPRVKFGISPFGIWRNKSRDSLGSATFGLPSYDAIYADSRKWLQNGWIDYIVPQIYWSQKNKAANYDTLTEWWSKNNFHKHLYIGHAPYKIDNDEKDESWNNYSEIPNQIRKNRSLKNIYGSVFFSSRVLKANTGNIVDSIQQQFYKYPAFTPPMKWIDSIPPEQPEFLKTKQTNDGILVSWIKSEVARDGEQPKAYIVYRFNGKNYSTHNPATIAAVIDAENDFFLDTAIKNLDNIEYGVTAIDRINNESSICLKTRLLAESSIKSVTLYLNKAFITRECKALADNKPVTISVKDLPADLDYSSLMVSAEEESSVELISFKHKVYQPEPEVDLIKKQELQDSIDLLSEKRIAVTDSLQVVSKLEAYLDKNQDFLNSNVQNVTIEGIKDFASYYEEKLFYFKQTERKLAKRKSNLDLAIKKLEDEYTIIPVDVTQEKSLVEIAIVAPKETEAKIHISYQTQQAGWKPEYNFYTSKNSDVFRMEYFANAWQNTGEDWENVDLKLATINGNLNSGQEYFSEPENYSLILEDSVQEDLTKERFEYKPLTFHQCALPVSIKNKDKNLKIKIKQKSTPKDFLHKVIPSRSLKVIKMARFYDWEHLGMYPGKMNVFYEKTLINSFDLALNKDTISMIVADESAIKVTREEIELKKPKFPASLFKKEREAYSIELFNKLNDPVRLVVEEPLPKSTDERLIINPVIPTKGDFNKNSGKYFWDLWIPAKGEDRLKQEFIVKYPKKYKIHRKTKN